MTILEVERLNSPIEVPETLFLLQLGVQWVDWNLQCFEKWHESAYTIY